MSEPSKEALALVTEWWTGKDPATIPALARRIDAHVAERTARQTEINSKLAELLMKQRDKIDAADAMAEAVKHILKTEAGILETKWQPLRSALAAYRALSPSVPDAQPDR